MITEHALPKSLCRRGQPLRVLIVGAGGNGSAVLLGNAKLMNDSAIATDALAADADPDGLSFTRTLRVARRSTASHPGFSPSGA